MRRKKNLVSWMRWRRSTVRTHRAYRAGIRNQQSFIWRAEYDDLWLGTKIKSAATMPPPSSLLTCIQEEGGFIKVNQSYARIGGGPLLPARASWTPAKHVSWNRYPPYLYLGTVGGIGTLHAQSSFPPHTGNKEGRGGRTTSFFAGPGKAEEETPPPIDRIIVK